MDIPGVSPLDNPVELQGVPPPENELYDDVIPTLFPSDYDSNNDSDKKDYDTCTSTQQRQRFIHSEDMPPMVRNVYNIRPRKQTDYMEENINRSMSLAQVGNDLN